MLFNFNSSLKFVVVFTLCAIGCMGPGTSNSQDKTWQEDFDLSKRKLVPTGRNDFFILEPGFQLTLESPTEKLVVTVLKETKEIDGVITRVVEEREWKNGKLKEISRNFFAICEETKDAFYFGEDVDMYKEGKVDSHSGAWVAGINGAKAGLIMPAKPEVGMKYYQELAEGIAMDRAEVIKLDETIDTPAGSFSDCLLTKESTAINPFEREFKTFVRGIGLVQDEKLLLTKHGFIEE